MEVHVHQLLLQKGVRVPEVIFYENHHEAFGMSVMLVREIPGSLVGDDLSMGEFERVLREAGKQLAVINQVPVEGFGWVRRGRNEGARNLVGEKNGIGDFIAEHLTEDLHFLSGNLLSIAEAARIQDILKLGASLMSRHESRLVHGDFDDSHIFQQFGKYKGIIDFGEIQGNSPLYDLGHYKLHDGQRYSGFKALSEGYQEVESLTAEDLLEIELWALWIGVRRLGIVGRRSSGKYVEILLQAVRREMGIIQGRL
ncbi:phosphotransferase [Paenibacillus sp. HJL G12]|uniref:Phosphotransferase n=1 Tax=Paenibacillus dendrobii TaxID=2691084 RepID=A0A7X3LIN3_9BACL|nr:phosphotransferase [Paenibacillus dendrobii]